MGSKTVSDSQDDMSSKNSSPMHQREFRRADGPFASNSSSQPSHITEGSKNKCEDVLDLLNPMVTTHGISSNVEVVIPSIKESSIDSSTSSMQVSSVDDTTGYNTPATSVGASAGLTGKRTRSRVNASDRAQTLRSGTLSQRTSLRGAKTYTAAISESAADHKRTDAALAHALQMEEYDEPPTKRQRIKRTLLPRDSPYDRNDSEHKNMSADSELFDVFDHSTPSLSPYSSGLDDFSETDDDLYFAREDMVDAIYQGLPRLHQQRSSTYRANEGGDEEDEDPPSRPWEDQRKLRRVSLLA